MRKGTFAVAEFVAIAVAIIVVTVVLSADDGLE